MDLIIMIEMELDIRIEKLIRFENEAQQHNYDDDYAKFHSRRMELESMKQFITNHRHDYD